MSTVSVIPYNTFVQPLITRFEELDPNAWVERHRLLDHVRPRMIREAVRQGIVPGDNTGAQERQVEELLVNEALKALAQGGRCQNQMAAVLQPFINLGLRVYPL